MCRTAVGLIVLVLVGCGGPRTLSGLPDDPDELTVVSVDGPAFNANDYRLTDEQQAKGVFYGYPILGRVVVSDPNERRAVIAAVKEGAARAVRERTPALACFDPRHGLRVVKDGRATEVVICFECSSYRLHRDPDGSQAGGDRMMDAPRDTLNKVLADANVPIAPTVHQVVERRQHAATTRR